MVAELGVRAGKDAGRGQPEQCCCNDIHKLCGAWYNMKRLRANVARRVPLLGGLIRPPRVAHDVLDVCGIGACGPLDGVHVWT